jgi:cytochrome oxidase Cu insertion factor (SCO1/SenC/PrrC family)
MIDVATQRRRRVQLMVIGALFFGPLALAFYLYYGGTNFVPHRLVSHGELLNPIRTVPEIRLRAPDGALTPPDFLRHKWSLVYPIAGPCDEACRGTIANLRAVRVALRRDAIRAQVVLLGPAGCCEDLGPANPTDGWWVASADAPEASEFRAVLTRAPTPFGASGDVYLIDPIGNFFMRYAPGFERKGMLSDLEKLLRLSHIG